MQRYERVNAEKIGVLLHQPFADFNANKPNAELPCNKFGFRRSMQPDRRTFGGGAQTLSGGRVQG